MSQSNTMSPFAPLGHSCADWLVNSKSNSRKAVESQTHSAQMRQIFKTYLHSKGLLTDNAHLIALSLRKSQDVYTGIQQKRWNTLDQIPVYIGAFDTSDKNAPVLKRWACYASGFTQNFAEPSKSDETQDANNQNTAQPNSKGYRKTTAKDGARILVTISTTSDAWTEVN